VTPVGGRRFVRLGTLEFVLEREAAGRRREARGAHGHGLEAPMPGVITKVMVVVGDDVAKGQPLLALEAMKMEHVIRAPRAGRVKSVSASPGQMVQAGATLVDLEDVAG
jgi:3-methylcrotonyl-CoA carboxylase alpha subunit